MRVNSDVHSIFSAEFASRYEEREREKKNSGDKATCSLCGSGSPATLGIELKTESMLCANTKA